jgi:hypothetical protein
MQRTKSCTLRHAKFADKLFSVWVGSGLRLRVTVFRFYGIRPFLGAENT